MPSARASGGADRGHRLRPGAHRYGPVAARRERRLTASARRRTPRAEERPVTLGNSGIVWVPSAKRCSACWIIDSDNAKKEFYLTDAVALARGDRLEARMVKSDSEEVLGVNSRSELGAAETLMQRRLRAEAMANGATLVAPETVFLSHDTRIGKDVVIEPHVVIGEQVVIEDGATIKASATWRTYRAGATVGRSRG